MKNYSLIFVLIASLIWPVKQANSAALANDKQLADIVSSLVQYIKWRGGGHNQINFCAAGLDTVGDEVNRIGKKNFTVIKNPSDSDLKVCHILYISVSEANNVDEILWKVKDLPIATISLIKGFAYRGGVIELVVEVDKLSFLINVISAKKANIIIKSDLLGIAGIISSE